MPFKRRYARKTGNRKRKVSKKPRVPRGVRTYVNRAIRRNEETKLSTVQYTLANFNSKINATGDLITLLPQIGVGVNQNNRIGNSIRPVRMEITGYVIYATQATTLNLDARMIGARLFCFQDKTSRSYANSIYNYNLLNLGGTSSVFDGTPLDWVAPHNKETFQWFADKKYKIMKPFGYTNNTTPSTSNAITGMDPSMFHPFKIVLTQKHMPSVLKYDQGDNLTYPTNFSPYLALGYCDLLNVGADVSTTQLSMEFNCTLWYKDA